LVKDKVKQNIDNLAGVEQLLISFLNHEPEPIGSPKELAGHMARLADIMRDSTIRTIERRDGYRQPACSASRFPGKPYSRSFC